MVFTYRIKERHRKKIEGYVEKGDFSSIAECITIAVDHYLDHMEERDFRIFVQSEEGRKRIKDLDLNSLFESFKKE